MGNEPREDLRISLRLPARMKEPLQKLAEREHRSMHGQIVQAIEEMLNNRGMVSEA
jgi:predicted transcriptional regulator